MDVKISKDKHIKRWVEWENLFYVTWNSIKTRAKRRRRGLMEEKKKALNEVEPVENINKNP